MVDQQIPYTNICWMYIMLLLKRSATNDILLKEASPAKQSNLKISTSTSQNPITNYFFVRDNSLEAVLARMTASEGLPFKIFITSNEIRKSLMARGFDIPKSATTIRGMVMKYGNIVRQKYRNELQNLKAQGKPFNLTFDEWTSTRNRRYLNINVHVKCNIWNLGLVRVYSSLPAERCVTLVEERLKLFGLGLHHDIVSITTDGAAVRQKVGKLLACKQQLCLAHAIHLAVLDVLYKKPKPLETVTNDDEFDNAYGSDDDSSEEEGDELQIVNNENELELIDKLHPLIQKVRRLVRLFRKSPTKNDHFLQKYIKQEFGKEMQLINDIKTRWNSLFLMLKRFYKVKNSILKSLIDLNSVISFDEEEWDMINMIIKILEPIELAVKALCSNDATLLTADVTISFMINNKGNDNDFAIQIKEALARRLNERRLNKCC